ncbi:MAG: hypothetical protein IKK34_11030 [Clostridia bacterium]|nr:hypothetical protein [Clostridia bacterium]
MKKIFAMVLAACLLCGAAALAETKSTILTAEIAEEYEITIPATVNIAFEATSTDLPVEVTTLRLLSKGTIADTVRKLYVQVSDNDDTLENANGDQINYTLGGSEAASGKWLYFTETGTKNFTVDITKAAWDAAPAGSYENTITFTVAIGDFQ